jgi:hypothetical protein
MGELVVKMEEIYCDRFAGLEQVICPVCENIQGEAPPIKKGDKWAWQCRCCNMIIENGKLFILDAVLEPTHYRYTRGGYSGSPDRVFYEMRKKFVTDEYRRRDVRRRD